MSGHDGHWSDCAVHNEPAYPAGPCTCGGFEMPDTPSLETALTHLKDYRARYSEHAVLCPNGLTTEDLDLIIAELEKRELPGNAG